jgi:hypothetical protein
MKKRVVLLGDSIRLIGYGEPVAERLADDFQVWQPDHNCRYAKHTLRELWTWSKHIEGCDVIHWNNGLWDVCDLFGDGPFTPLDQYVEEMLRLAELLKKRTRVLIFATTTPVRPENPYNKNEVIAAYNAALVPKLQALGVRINDLYTPIAADVERYIRADDLIHLTEEGSALCAELVERAIRAAADTLCPVQSAHAVQNPANGAGAPI